jgi:class 3 adenylate cyclase
MIRCASCSAEWPDGARFCGICGTSLTRACRSCGEPLPEAARFCLSCGTQVDVNFAPASPVDAQTSHAGEERRRVTVLFADLVGFTERSDQADPEDVRTSLVPFHERAKKDIERYGGTLDKFIGDAVMGVFGAPVAHEDDPLRAVRAALGILRTVQELRAHDPLLEVRIAVNTGEAVVALGEAGPRIGEAVAGDVVNTASRMEGLAPIGGVVIGESTYRSVRDRFEVKALPPATVKGKSEPLRLWHVLTERDQAAIPSIAPTRFVGREAELSLLLDVISRTVERGMAHAVTIVGDPGMGKSRLADELRLRLEGRVAWLEGRCLPYGDAITFAPIADLVRAVAETGSDLGDGAISVRLATAVGDSAGPEGVVSPGEIGAALANLIGLLPGPVVVAVHDMHWAEEVILEVLGHAFAHLAGKQVVALMTTRPDLFDRYDRWPPPGADATTQHLSSLTR